MYPFGVVKTVASLPLETVTLGRHVCIIIVTETETKTILETSNAALGIFNV